MLVASSRFSNLLRAPFEFINGASLSTTLLPLYPSSDDNPDPTTMSSDDSPPNSLAALTHPESWLLVAQGLLLSAEFIWASKVAPFWNSYLKEVDQLQQAGAEELVVTPETMQLASSAYNYVFPCVLLSGYTIENTLKAIRVEQLSQQGRSAYRQAANGSVLLPQLLVTICFIAQRQTSP